MAAEPGWTTQRREKSCPFQDSHSNTSRRIHFKYIVTSVLTIDPEVPGSIPGSIRDFLRNRVSGTGSTQPREDN
jgi:hypothetical protein